MAVSTEVDPFTPWADTEAELRARHVGRTEEIRALESAVRAFLGGGNPLPVYLFGPRGAGKSHLLTLLRHDLTAEAEAAGAQIKTAGEDLPRHRAAAPLLDLALGRRAVPWTTWGRVSAPEPDPTRRTVLLWEGFDTKLETLDREERRALRALLLERPWLYVVATGATLGDELTGPEEAFKGHFDPRPLQPMSDAEAGELLDYVTGRSPPPPRPGPGHEDSPGPSEEDLRWEPRRRALVLLAGGNPRALLQLGLVAQEQPDALAADDLAAVLRGVTGHYQNRWRDLNPTAQQIVDLIARAPAQLGAGDIAPVLRAEPPPITTACRRLLQDGVLAESKQGHRTSFTVAEPMFRFWLEYRTAPPADARTGWIGRVLEVIWTPQEIAMAWLGQDDPELRSAAENAVARNPGAQPEAWSQAGAALRAAREKGDVVSARKTIDRARTLPMGGAWLLRHGIDMVIAGWPEPFNPLPFRRSDPDGTGVRALVALDLAARNRWERVKDAFVRVVEAFGSVRGPSRTQLLFGLDRAVLVSLARMDRRGRPWQLQPSQARRLASVPFLRIPFLRRGRNPGHPPLLVPADLLGRVAPEDPDLEDVLAAAHLLRAPALLAVAASLLARRNRVLLPACPRPELPCDGSPDDVGRSIAAHLAGGRGWLAWTWAASLSGVGDAVWQAVLDADNPRNWVSLTTARLPWLARPLEIALVALGTRRPDRLAELRRRARPEALPFVDRADSALALFRSGLRGPLHPEIEALRRLVVPAGDKS